MPKIHNMITRGQWTSAIKAALGVSKESGGIERFGETLTPSINLWDLDVPEWSYLRDDTLFVGQAGVAAIAAEFSYVAFALLPTAGAIMVIEHAAARSGSVTCAVQIGTRALAAATLTPGSSVLNRDLRFTKGVGPPAQRVVGIVEVLAGTDPSSTALGADNEELMTTATAYTPAETVPYIIKPGMCFALRCGTVNTTMQYNIAGRVRQALPGELD